MNVVVIGASNKPHRYSYQAVVLLGKYGHNVFPVHKRIQEIEGVKVYKAIGEINEDVDIVTMYVGKDISSLIGTEIITKKPKKIIFNPGAENTELANDAQKNGIEVIEACTLVLLRTNQF